MLERNYIRHRVRVQATAGRLTDRLGKPVAGVILGSGFAGLATEIGTGGHHGGVWGASCAGGTIWLFPGRAHLYEGGDPWDVVFPVDLLAEAGAGSIVLTCAAGGLRPDDRTGDFAMVSDHINMTGFDPLTLIPPDRRKPAFLDLQNAYDPAMVESWVAAAEGEPVRVRTGVLSAVRGPSYETPAEVRMLQSLGADIASMSVVPETIWARYRGMRVTALACLANPGAGIEGGGAIRHEQVLKVVEKAVREAVPWLVKGLGQVAGLSVV
jgi:purine-nucleoside phosphorylase